MISWKLKFYTSLHTETLCTYPRSHNKCGWPRMQCQVIFLPWSYWYVVFDLNDVCFLQAFCGLYGHVFFPHVFYFTPQKRYRFLARLSCTDQKEELGNDLYLNSTKNLTDKVYWWLHLLRGILLGSAKEVRSQHNISVWRALGSSSAYRTVIGNFFKMEQSRTYRHVT